MALAVRTQATRDVFDRINSWLTGSYAHQNGFYVEAVGVLGESDRNRQRSAFDYDFYGMRVGVDKQTGNTLLGGSLSITGGDIDGAGLSSENVAIQADVYGSVYAGPFFVSAEAGIAQMMINDIERATGLGPIEAKGSTDATQYSAAIETGAIFKMGQVALMPAVGAGYIHSEVDGFSETAPILALTYQDRELNTGIWWAKLRASTALGASGTAHAYVEAGYEDFFGLNDDGITAQLAGNTAAAVNISLDDPDARGVFAKIGYSGKVTETITLDAAYGISFQEGNGETHSGRLRVKMPIDWDGTQ